MSQYRAYFVPGGVDPKGQAKWHWMGKRVTKHAIAYNRLMTRPGHKTPNLYIPGLAEAIGLAAYKDSQLTKVQGSGLNVAIMAHHVAGKGKDLNLTSQPVIEGEVVAALTPKHNLAWGGIKWRVQNFTCNHLGVRIIGDVKYSPIARVNFTSSIFVIRGGKGWPSEKM